MHMIHMQSRFHQEYHLQAYFKGIALVKIGQSKLIGQMFVNKLVCLDLKHPNLEANKDSNSEKLC